MDDTGLVRADFYIGICQHMVVQLSGKNILLISIPDNFLVQMSCCDLILAHSRHIGCRRLIHFRCLFICKSISFVSGHLCRREKLAEIRFQTVHDICLEGSFAQLHAPDITAIRILIDILLRRHENHCLCQRTAIITDPNQLIFKHRVCRFFLLCCTSCHQTGKQQKKCKNPSFHFCYSP